MKDNRSFGIIGGGLMGISLARDLKNEGHQVSIIEGADVIGGLTVPTVLGKYTWDKFYHVILPDDIHTIDLIKYAGLERDLNWKHTRTGFYINKAFYSMSDISEFLKFPTLNLLDKFRLGLTILAGSYMRNYNRLEQIPVTTWLIRWSGKKTFNNIWLPLLKAKLGEGYKSTSAAFICATIKRLYGARKSGSKKEIFGYVKGGYAKILEGVLQKLISNQIKIITGFKVKEVSRNDKQMQIISQNGKVLEFDYVISTLPSGLTANMIPSLKPEELTALKNIKYLGVACVSVLLKKQLTPYYVTNITDPDIPFTGVIEMTSLVDREHFDGNALIYLPKYLNSDHEMFEWGEDKLRDYFITQLKNMQPELTDEDIIATNVARARNVITLPEMGYSLRLPHYSTSVKNFFIINSSFITDGTLNVNETIKVAKTYLPKVLNLIENEEKAPGQHIS